ncbi:MAG: hypothetical protein H0A76_13190 [Candidatus Thiodubiliella endoseptemdiera]|uniref:Uncharacterized protein n=1 Tax=Candidatus Thiodubiliella endoseptemdiera TaxID=2738886 RepID=A0A853F998_9GAMM|nr:hypothetical protein [Candidatus Thiodubiliella endoseptemdiera]
MKRKREDEDISEENTLKVKRPNGLIDNSNSSEIEMHMTKMKKYKVFNNLLIVQKKYGMQNIKSTLKGHG